MGVEGKGEQCSMVASPGESEQRIDLSGVHVQYSVLGIKCNGLDWHEPFRESYFDVSSLIIIFIIACFTTFVMELYRKNNDGDDKEACKCCFSPKKWKYIQHAFYAANLLVQSICLCVAYILYLDSMVELESNIEDWNSEKEGGSCGFSIYLSVFLFKPFQSAMLSLLLTVTEWKELWRTTEVLTSIKNNECSPARLCWHDLPHTAWLVAALFLGLAAATVFIPLAFYGIGIVIVFAPIVVTMLLFINLLVILAALAAIAITLLVILPVLQYIRKRGLESENPDSVTHDNSHSAPKEGKPPVAVIKPQSVSEMVKDLRSLFTKRNDEAGIKASARMAILAASVLLSLCLYFSLYYIHDCGWTFLSREFFLSLFNFRGLAISLSWPVDLPQLQQWSLGLSLTFSSMTLSASFLCGSEGNGDGGSGGGGGGEGGHGEQGSGRETTSSRSGAHLQQVPTVETQV